MRSMPLPLSLSMIHDDALAGVPEVGNMTRQGLRCRLVTLAIAVSCLLSACGSDGGDSASPGLPGRGGSSGTGGIAGTAGAAGTGGSAGAAGAAGASGAGGAAGAGGSAGTAGMAGAGQVSFWGDWDKDPAQGGWKHIQVVSASKLTKDATLRTWHDKGAGRVEVDPGDDPLHLGSGTERAEVLTMQDASSASIPENQSSGTQYFAISYRFPVDWSGTEISGDPIAGRS